MQQKNYSYILSWAMSLIFLIFSPNLLANNAASGGSGQLTASAISMLRQDLSKQTAVAVEKLQLVEVTKEAWSDGCLGLPKPDEFCSQSLVDGWRVTFSDGSQRWSYHTDMSGQTYRLAQEPG